MKHTTNDFARHFNSFNENIAALKKCSLRVDESLSTFNADQKMLEFIRDLKLTTDEYDQALRDINNALYASKSGVILPFSPEF